MTGHTPSNRGDWITIGILGAVQALSQSGQVVIMTVTALVGIHLSEAPWMATLPLACQFLGVLLGTVPASLLMEKFGRKRVFLAGQMLAVCSSLTAMLAVYQTLFSVFLLASIGMGVHNAIWQYLRFAATECVSKTHHATAISCVMAGGVVAAFLGPWLATFSRDLLTPVTFAGCYVGIAALAAINMILLRIPEFPDLQNASADNRAFSVLALLNRPDFPLAVASAAIGYGVMILVMTAAPLSMSRHGHSFESTAFAIQWHVVGMYAPSFFTAKLVARFGIKQVICTGIMLNMVAAVTNLSGTTLVHYWVGLFAVGVGWNFMFIGGTTLLTQITRPNERARAQALNDFLVFGIVATSSFASGFLFSLSGWTLVNNVIALPLCLLLLTFLLSWPFRIRRASPLQGRFRRSRLLWTKMPAKGISSSLRGWKKERVGKPMKLPKSSKKDMRLT